MVRTSADAVITVLGADYGPLPDGTMPVAQILAAIDEANLMTTQVYNYAITYREVTLAATTLEMIERLLAAHNYAMSDQPLATKSNGRSSATFQGQTNAFGIKGTKYGQRAITTDYTRTLAAMDEGRIAVTGWLGKEPSAQIAYSDRD